jgi:predicted outer membrane protein
MNKFHPLCLGAAVLTSAALLAQEPPTRTPTNPNNPTNPTNPSTQPAPGSTMPGARPNLNTTNSTSGDAVLVTWLLVDNENEIELSRIALQRAQSPEVKQFAQKMIDDHTQIVQKLQQQAGTAGARTGHLGDMRRDPATGRDPNTGRDPAKGSDPVTGRDPATGRDPGAGRDPNTGRDPATGRDPVTGRDPATGATGRDPATGATGRDPATGRDVAGRVAQDASAMRPTGGSIDHERLIRDLGRQCLASATQALQEKQGAEFDKCFMGMQVAAHMKAIDTIEVFRNYASESLRPVLDEGLRTVQTHAAHAKDLMKRTESANAAK